MIVRKYLLAIISSILLLTACGHSAPTNYYILESSYNHAVPAKPIKSSLYVGVGPVTTAKYLDKQGIVIRDNTHELSYSDFNYWAEPLDDNTQRVLSDNLSYLLPKAQVVTYPWRARNKVNYQVKVDVIRFDTDVAGNSVLKAQWGIYTADKQVLVSKTGIYKATVQMPNNYQSIATAMSENLQSLSQDIASSLQQRIKLFTLEK